MIVAAWRKGKSHIPYLLCSVPRGAVKPPRSVIPQQPCAQRVQQKLPAASASVRTAAAGRTRHTEMVMSWYVLKPMEFTPCDCSMSPYVRQLLRILHKPISLPKRLTFLLRTKTQQPCIQMIHRGQGRQHLHIVLCAK